MTLIVLGVSLLALMVVLIDARPTEGFRLFLHGLVFGTVIGLSLGLLVVS